MFGAVGFADPDVLFSPSLMGGEGRVVDPSSRWREPDALFFWRDLREAATTGCRPADVGGRFLIWVEGRLDNRDDLARMLGIDLSDAVADLTLIAAAWAKWQEESLCRLLGDFALAVWDRQERALTLACDGGTGGRSLFYHQTAGRLVFASTLSVLLRIKGVPHDLDLPVVAASAHWQWPSEGRTWYRQVRQLPPAGRLRWSRGRCDVDRYWRPDWSRRVRFARDADYVDAARELLDRAVAVHSRVSGPLVCELSGGLDSTAVAATLARLHPSRAVHCITLVPAAATLRPPETGTRFHDESEHAAAVARRYPNIIHHQVAAVAPVTGDLDPIPRFARSGGPFSNLFDRAWIEEGRRRVRELGAGTLLTGISGNLTLSHGGLVYLADLARQGRWLSLYRHASQLAGWPGLRRRGLLRRAVTQALKPDIHFDPHDLGPALRPAYRRSPFQGDVKGPYNTRERQRLLEHLIDAQRVAVPYERSWYGIELRDPLAYRPLLEFCFAIPAEQYLAGGMPRSLARRVLADRLPASVVQEVRRGRQAPELSTTIWHARADLRAELDLLARSDAVTEILDIQWLRATLEALPTSPALIRPADAYALRLTVTAMTIGRFILWVEEGSPGLDVSPAT